MSTEIIDVTIPEQPPVGSVALDAEGRAWQRITIGGEDRWYRAGVSILGGGLHWPYLVLQRKPLTVIHRPEAEA